MIQRLTLLVSSFCLVSCADFLNSKTPNTSSPSGKSIFGSGNQFAAGFDPNSGPFSEQSMLANIGLNVIAPTYEQFAVEVTELNDSLKRTCEIMSRQVNSDLALQATKDRWVRSMLAYHRIAATAIGPLVDEYYGERIYAWPKFDTCGIDLDVARGALSGEFKFGDNLVTKRGLGALEYLLFESTLDTACNKRNVKNADAVNWSQKEFTAKKLDRCQHAQVVVNDVLTLSRELANRWHPLRGNFTRSLVDGSKYTNLNEAVLKVNHILFETEKLKDDSLGIPLGLHRGCQSEDHKCLSDVEHRYSALSLAALAERMKMFLQVFTGTGTNGQGVLGFDDFLTTAGFPAVSQDVLEKARLALSNLQNLAMRDSMYSLIEQMDIDQCKRSNSEDRKVEICAVHADLRELVIKLKTDYLSALSTLKAPKRAEGDND